MTFEDEILENFKDLNDVVAKMHEHYKKHYDSDGNDTDYDEYKQLEQERTRVLNNAEMIRARAIGAIQYVKNIEKLNNILEGIW